MPKKKKLITKNRKPKIKKSVKPRKLLRKAMAKQKKFSVIKRLKIQGPKLKSISKHNAHKKIIKHAKNEKRQRKIIIKTVKKIAKNPEKIIVNKVIKKTISHPTVNIKKNVMRRIKKPVSERHEEASEIKFPAESLFKAKIKVIGIGGGGGSIVSEIGRSLDKATFVIADTDIRALKKKSGIKYFWFGQDLTHGLGTGVNVELAKQAAESAKEKISSFFKDQDIIIFVASLGGGLGSGATQVFAEVAKEFGGITLGIFTMPFKFEGKNKYRIAQTALKSLRESLNVSLVIPNEKIFKIIDESTPITNAFSIVNKSLIESLESLIDLIYNPGIINIDFADLRTILKGRGNSAFLNTVEESGKNRVEKICEKIFKNPLLQNSNFKAGKILFDISGSENLSMFEVEKISRHISAQNPNAKIIFGISKDSKLKNNIKTTILMTSGQVSEDKLTVKIESPEKIIIEKNKELSKKAIVIKDQKKKVKPLKNKRAIVINKTKKQESVSLIPVFESQKSGNPVALPISEQKKTDIAVLPESNKKTIRRSGLEIKKEEELQEKKRIAQEKEWEIPTFLRKIKLKS